MPVTSSPRIYRKKPFFTVEIPGIGSAQFQSCSPLKSKVAKIVHWEGGAMAPSQQPGRSTTDDVVLARGKTSDLDMYTWFKQTVDAAAMVEEPNHEKQVHVVERSRTGKELQRWILAQAWVTEYEGGEWGDADEVAIEKVTLAVRYFELGG
jgi:phage tail-like protein